MHRNATSPAATARGPWTDGLSDLSIAGDPLAFPHLAVDNAPRHPATVAGFAALARRIAADRARWEPLVRYDALTRWYARLETGPGYEVWLLSWLPGQGTGLHDHGASAGVLTVVRGELAERSMGGDGRRVRTLRPGRTRVLPGAHRPGPGAGRHVHEVVNASLEPAVSVHVYSPGLVEMNPYPATVVRQGAPETV
ncbi:cysteine dioxygenase [Streptomyces sp. NPDC092296]|uniref:cysteine dioxygenase n=1 Tax=Streptomyces sp. NPDC092296 TaxID=3366012 RepID=UPI0037FDEACD